MATALYAAVLLEGAMLSVPGPTLDSLAELTGSNLGDIGILFTANGLGFVVGALLAGRLFARLAGTRLLAIALFAMGAMSLTVPTLGSLTGMVLVFVVIGMSIGLVDVGGNTLIVWLYGKEAAPHMNTLHLSWGVGAFATPLVVAQIAVSTGQAHTVYTLFGAVMLLTALWLLLVPSPEVPVDARPSANPAVMRRHARVIALMGVLFFIHVGAELAFGGWVYSYATATQIGPETTARVLNSVFWGGLVVGRIAAIPLSRRLSAAAMIQFDLIGAGVALAIVGLVPGWGTWAGTALFGMSIASIFASCLNYTGSKMPTTSQITSVFLIGASLGSMTLPWVVGQLFGRVGPQAMIYVVGMAIAVGLVVFGLIRSHLARSSAHPGAAA